MRRLALTLLLMQNLALGQGADAVVSLNFSWDNNVKIASKANKSPNAEGVSPDKLSGAFENAPAWDLFVEAMETTASASHTSIFSRHAMNRDRLTAELNALKAAGLIKNLPAEQRLFVGSAASAKEKLEIMKRLLDRMEEIPMPATAQPVIDLRGMGRIPLHRWAFSDNDSTSIDTAIKVLGPQVQSGRWPHLKIVLLFTGSRGKRQRPAEYVLKNDGTARRALPTETGLELRPNANTRPWLATSVISSRRTSLSTTR